MAIGASAQEQEIGIACVFVPNFPLQLLRRTLPEDFRSPFAVVDRESAGAVIMYVDECAAQHRIHPGLRYSTAAAMCPQLHAAPVHHGLIQNAHGMIMRQLQEFSPGIEPVRELPGAYYLDIRGMRRLAPDTKIWAENIRNRLFRRQALRVNIVAGFTRFGVLTAARTLMPAGSVALFDSPARERYAALRAPLNLLAAPSRNLDELGKLDVRCIKDLLRLPEREIKVRFGEDLLELAQQAKGGTGSVYAVELPQPYEADADFEYPQNDIEQLLAAVSYSLGPVLERMKRNRQGAKALRVRLRLERGSLRSETLNTAEPTLDNAAMIQLLRLRFSALDLGHGVTGFGIRLIPAPLPDAQISLDQSLAGTVRELTAADRALTLACAEFGPDRVVRARCADSNLPGESFFWEFFDRMRKPSPSHMRQPCLIRRIHDRPRRIGTPRRAALDRVLGPYHVSGYWWREESVRQSHYYVQDDAGAVQWIFYDAVARQWFELGSVQ